MVFYHTVRTHHGGLHEAAVKSTKKHLLRVICHQNLTFSEYHTLPKQVEASVNSRPICPISDDPNDLDTLTPGHFLIGAPRARGGLCSLAMLMSLVVK